MKKLSTSHHNSHRNQESYHHWSPSPTKLFTTNEVSHLLSLQERKWFSRFVPTTLHSSATAAAQQFYKASVQNPELKWPESQHSGKPTNLFGGYFWIWRCLSSIFKSSPMFFWSLKSNHRPMLFSFLPIRLFLLRGSKIQNMGRTDKKSQKMHQLPGLRRQLWISLHPVNREISIIRRLRVPHKSLEMTSIISAI